MAAHVQLGDEEELYLLHHESLTHVVARCVDGSRALIEDSCSFAWSQLVCHQPGRHEGLFGWLCTVAIREGWRLSRLERCDDRLDVDIPGSDGPLSVVGSVEDCAHRWHASSKRAPRSCASASSGARQRRMLALQVAGFSHREIAALTGDSVRTVDRQLRRAHEHVRWSRR